MVRADRQMPDVFFGRPGALVKLPWPRGGIDRTYERQTFDFLTGAGNHAVSSLSTGSIAYGMTWNALHVDNYMKLHQYRVGANGPGPWAFIDPTAPNLLPVNVAAATGLYSNAEGFYTGEYNGLLSSNADPTYIYRPTGFRSLKWTFPAFGSDYPVLSMHPMYRNWPGIPVAPNLPYTFSARIRPDNVLDSSMTVAMKMAFLDRAGVVIGAEQSSGDITVTGWQRLSATGTSPSNVAYVRCLWVGIGASLATNSSFYIDEPMLEQDNVVNDWAPGTGTKPVEIVGLTEPVPFATRFRQGIQFSLREVAR